MRVFIQIIFLGILRGYHAKKVELEDSKAVYIGWDFHNLRTSTFFKIVGCRIGVLSHSVDVSE